MKPLALRHMPLEQQTKLSEERLRGIEALLRIRWSTSDWTERFAQFRADNEKRMG